MKSWIVALTPLIVAFLGVLSAYVRGKEADADGSTREGGTRLMASIMDGQNRILDQLEKLEEKVDGLEARLSKLEEKSRGRKWE